MSPLPVLPSAFHLGPLSVKGVCGTKEEYSSTRSALQWSLILFPKPEVSSQYTCCLNRMVTVVKLRITFWPRIFFKDLNVNTNNSI